MTLHAITDLPAADWQRIVDDLIEQAIDVLNLGTWGYRGEQGAGGHCKPASREPGAPHHMDAQAVALRHVEDAKRSLRAAARVMRNEADKAINQQPATIESDRNPRWDEHMTREEFVGIFEGSGLTLREFASRLGRSKTHMHDIKEGRRRITPDVAQRVRACFVRKGCPQDFDHKNDND